MDPESKKELPKQTVEPRQALELAINMDFGMRRQHQIQQQNKIVTRPTSTQFNLLMILDPELAKFEQYSKTEQTFNTPRFKLWRNFASESS